MSYIGAKRYFLVGGRVSPGYIVYFGLSDVLVFTDNISTVHTHTHIQCAINITFGKKEILFLFLLL